MTSPFLKEEQTLGMAAPAPEHLHCRKMPQAGFELALKDVATHLRWVSKWCESGVIISRDC